MIREEKIQIGQLVFDCRISGNKDDELVILLHGFPETSHMWRKLLQELTPLGFYCIAPNMRGYSQGARPRGKKHYTIDKLSHDIAEIAKAVGKEKFHLIGHDWGAAIGWYLVHENPNLILSWSALSVPHISAFAKAITTDKDQIQKSQYIKNFQIPYLPELKIKKNDFALFRKLWKYSDAAEVKDYLAVLKGKKALTSALNYYRANYKLLRSHSIAAIQVPTLFIWGEKDMAIGSNGVENSHQYMKGDYKFVKLDTGHWLIQTDYAAIKKELTEHLLKYKKNEVTPM